MTTIQELEKINTENYKDSPQELVTIAKQLLNLKKFEKGIEIAETAIHYAITKNEGDEANINCAKFYYFYADALIRKCMESDEVLAMPNEANENKEDIQEQNEEEEENKEVNKNEINININPHKSNIEAILEQRIENSNKNEDAPEITNVNENEEKEEDDEDNQVPQDDSDEQVALENLLFAEKIYNTFLNKYEDTSREELEKTPEIITYFYDLAQVYQKLGELEMCKSDFRSAIDCFTKSLKIRSKYDYKFSRAIAELYFNMATAFDFDSKKCLLSYYKTKLIMEYHLKEELNKNGYKNIADKIKINGEDLELEEMTTTHSNLYVNIEVTNGDDLNNEKILKIEDIEELVGIITELNQKIEDVIIDINDFEKYKKEKEELQQDQNHFTSDYDKTKVVDLNATGLIKKRQRKDENVDHNESEQGGRDQKLEK